jgi:tetratricopeptide (TPR) repeat protein
MGRFLTLLALVLTACGPRESLPSGSAASFDVVLITLDTTRADRLGAYGYEKAATPNLDRLAREGIRFADAVSPAPITLVAHASILTGLDPDHHGVRHNGQYRLDASQLTLAEVLRDKDYETAAFVSGFVLDARYGLSQGFERYDDRTEPLPGQPFGGLGERNAEATTDAVLAWLGERNGSRPFFLWVHYYDPHTEYKPPEAYASRFPTAPYDGEIAYMDSQIGRLVAELEKTGSDLLVVVAGDHGESFGEHSEYGHSRFLYESTQRVPLFLWSPGSLLTPQVVEGTAVGLVDIFPTVLDLLGIAGGPRIDGVSLRLASEERERALYMETMAGYLESGWAPLFGLRRHQDKLIQAPRPEYYRLLEDPHEREDLYLRSKDEEPVSTLSSRLSDRLASGPAAEVVAASAVKPDAESLRQLQALGYLSGGGPATDSESELPDPKDMLAIQGITMESRGLRKEGRLDDALARSLEAFQRAPKDLGVLEELALVYIEMNRIDDAERALRAYSDLKANPNIYMLLAVILAETGRRPEGEALLQEAMELEPDHGGVLITWGDFLAARGDYREAMEYYQKAKRVDPYRATELADRKIVDLRKRAGGG